MIAMGWLVLAARTSSLPAFDLSQAKFVGQSQCANCHRDIVEKFKNSHHDKAMDVANEHTVLGDFSGQEIERHGIVSRMFRQDGKFMVNTEGPDGQMHDYEVKYVFGVTPLQQYMVEFGRTEPSSRNSLPRVQVLRVCWDTLAKKWFNLDPPDVTEKLAPTDDLHWTGIAQRWNNMCAECHSTDFQKNFDAARNEYHSTFIEIDVSCEACHGPGSVHVELAGKWLPGWNRNRGYGLANLKLSAENQIQACAPCHSRRNVVQAGFRAGSNYYDHYSSQLLSENVYYPDGQILDEDYEHGSFIQSKMYHKGIRCSDCHDPHTARLKHDGNQVCTSCHQHPVAKYDSVTHHFHKPDSEGAKCVNCHMPTTTYMAVDARRDHSLRIPRPDLSLKIDSPNACAGCHLQPANVAAEKRKKLRLYQDWMLLARACDEEVKRELQRANQWCDEACEKWYGSNRRRDEHFGLAISAGQKRSPDAAQQLAKLLAKRGPEAPAIARATALELLSQVNPQLAGNLATQVIQDDSPIVRAAATSALLGNPSLTQSISLLESALTDPVRSVRTEAARNLLEYPRGQFSASASSNLRQALNELNAGALANNDRAGAHLMLGIFAEQEGRNRQAIEHYQDAIRVEPGVAGPRSNLAALLERGLDSQMQQVTNSDRNTTVQSEIRRLRSEELPLLQRDAKLVPNIAMVQYRYGMALYLNGQRDAALSSLMAAANLAPTDAQFAQAVAMLLENLQRWEEAIQWTKKLIDLAPQDPQHRMLLTRIEEAARATKKPE